MKQPNLSYSEKTSSMHKNYLFKNTALKTIMIVFEKRNKEKNRKFLSFFNKLKFTNPCRCKPLIYLKTLIIWSNYIHRLKYQRSPKLGY